MSDLDYLQWPFFDDRHRGLAAELDAWAAEHIPHGHGADVDAECRALVRLLGQAGWLRHAVGGTAHGGAGEAIASYTHAAARPQTFVDFLLSLVPS
ncbi:acyl-CoA dehydrogenase family protein, partial [Ralstonia pseudosolanacearum]